MPPLIGAIVQNLKSVAIRKINRLHQTSGKTVCNAIITNTSFEAIAPYPASDNTFKTTYKPGNKASCIQTTHNFLISKKIRKTTSC